MIDWINLVINAVWITGCMLALAVLGISQWQARDESIPLRVRDVLARPKVQILLNVAAILFGLGMLGTSSEWYERFAWGALVIAFSAQGLLAYRRAHKSRSET